MLTPEDLNPFQNDGIDYIYEHDESLAFVKMGGGKTVMSATAMGELMADCVLNRILIVAPKKVALLVWPPEFRNWSHLQNYTLNVAVGTAKQRTAALREPSDFTVINWENLVWAVENGLLEGYDGLILDEITYAQNPGAKRARALQKIARQFKVRVGLTGSPGALDRMFGVVKAVDRGRRLGSSFAPFRRQYYRILSWEEGKEPPPYGVSRVRTDMGETIWQERDTARDEVLDRISDMTFIVEPKDYEAQLPPLVSRCHEVVLPASIRKMYWRAAKKFVFELPDRKIVAESAGVLVGKLQQLVNGFLYTHDAEAGDPIDWTWLHDEKIWMLEEMFESLGGEPAIVAYKYQAELAALLEAFPGTPVLGGGISDRKSAEAERLWNERRTQLLFLHPRAAGHGLNLQKGGNRIIWYGLPWSLEEHEQTIARLRRTGQDADQVFCDYIVARGTLDENIVLAQQHKKNVEEAILAGIRERMSQ